MSGECMLLAGEPSSLEEGGRFVWLLLAWGCPELSLTTFLPFFMGLPAAFNPTDWLRVTSLFLAVTDAVCPWAIISGSATFPCVCPV
jgi:hypothetical protein